MKILFLGDVVGRPGRRILKNFIPDFRKTENIDIVVANGENAAAGSGLTPKIADEIFESEVDAITSGDHIWKRKDIYDYLKVLAGLIRPANYPDGAIGRGSTVVEAANGVKVGIINLIGRVFMDAVDCPFAGALKEIKNVSDKAKVIVVDFHAEATSEKIAMGWYLDGKVSAVLGTHTHIATADERVLPGGTAYITDCGMCGPYDSVIGRKKDLIIEHFKTKMPFRFEMAEDDVQMRGVIIDVDEISGKARGIKRVCVSEN